MELIKTEKEAFNECKVFFNELSALLSGEQYEVMKSCNNDKSLYLIPKGTRKQVTYYSKPLRSFRLSDHWNWFSNLSKCVDEMKIQGCNPDLPSPTPRLGFDKASEPIYANCVGYYDSDYMYHTIFGEAYDEKTDEWYWITNDAKDFVKSLKGE